MTASTMRQWPIAIGVLFALVLVSLVLAIRVGAVGLDTTEVVGALAGRGDAVDVAIVRGLRAPRALLAALVGAALALAGACFQALLRNPLADPYILGIASGASTGAVLAVATGVSVLGVWTLPVAGFVGALLALVLVLRIAVVGDGIMDGRTMLLAGVIVASFAQAVVLLALAVTDDVEFRTALLWTMGSLAGATWERATVLSIALVLCIGVLLPVARALNLLAIGEVTAAVLGTQVERTKWRVLGAASLLTAVAVSMAGTIGFVGLVVPHAVRLVCGSDNRLLLPASMLAGASFLVMADLIARTVVSPGELPLGVITALIGVPVFVVLLRRKARA
jgi:iron complex transport system permease protein